LVNTPSRRVIERRDSRGNLVPLQGSRRVIGTPQGARGSARRPSTPGSVTKYYRIDDNGQRVEIDPPAMNGNFKNLTPSRRSYVAPPVSANKIIQKPSNLPKSPVPIART
jgi:hypothetical protein